MLKNIEPGFASFLENYAGSIKNKFLSEINSGRTLFIFSGPSGSGKDFLAESAAKDLKFELKKLNLYTLEPDDSGNLGASMYSTIKNMASSTSLFGGGKKLIYLEDLEKVLSVDPSLLTKIKSIPGSIIILESSSGDIFRAKYKKYLADYSIIKFYRLNKRIAKLYAMKIASLNHLSIPMSAIDSIAENSGGNLSSVFTDMNMVSITGSATGQFASRLVEDTIFDRIKSVFSGTADLRYLYFPSDMEAKNMEIWLADKAGRAFSRQDLYKFLLVLSHADIVLRRIKKQNWGLMKYFSALLAQGMGSVQAKFPLTIDYTAPDWDAYYSIY